MDLPPPIVEMSPVHHECVEHAAATYQFHSDILYAILIVEGGTVGRFTSNSDGSVDIGPAQINSVHLDELYRMGISEDELRNDGCLNIYVAARYVVQSMIDAGPVSNPDDYLRAIARYHSKTPQYNRIYAEKLRDAFSLIYQVSPKNE